MDDWVRAIHKSTRPGASVAGVSQLRLGARNSVSRSKVQSQFLVDYFLQLFQPIIAIYL